MDGEPRLTVCFLFLSSSAAVEDCSFNSTPSFNFCSDKPSKGVVKKELLSRLGRYKVGKKYEGCFPARPVTEILREAEGWVGRAIQYHLCSMNCEHFATWLRYGVRLSEQVQCCQKVIEMVSDRPSPLPLSSPQSC